MNTKSVEGWYIIFQVLSVIFVMLTVGTGAGTIITGYIANRRQTKAIAEANTNAADAAKEVAKLQISVADAERKRAEAERALLELQERLAPRVITAEQRKRFIEFMASIEKGKVELRFTAGNNESNGFAILLQSMLTDSGCEVVGPIRAFILTSAPEYGIGMRIKNKDAPPIHSGNLQKAFAEIGIPAPCSLETSNPLDDDTVRIFVYGKN